MKKVESRRKVVLRAALVAGALVAPLTASGEDKIYPPGTACANQATIAERLLCGRQEFRREHGLSVRQPAEAPSAPQQEGQVFPETPAAPTTISPAPEQQRLLPRTSSPSH